MASKNELESENISLKMRIKELEGSLSGDSSAPSVADVTHEAIMRDVDSLRKTIEERDAKISDLEGKLSASHSEWLEARKELSLVRAEQQQQQPVGTAMSAKDISRGLLYREIDESALFVQI